MPKRSLDRDPLPAIPCRECGESFVPVHGNSRYCSRVCRWRHTNDKFRAKWEGSTYWKRERRVGGWRRCSAVRGLECSDEAADYVRVLALDPCSYCGQPSQDTDHIVARDAGGSNEWDNLTAACKRCNHVKTTKSLLMALCRLNGAWYAEAGVLEKAA